MNEYERLQRDLDDLAAELRRLGIRHAVIEEKLSAVKEDVDHLTGNVERRYVPVVRYQQVERVVFGIVAAVGIAIIGSLMALVLR